MAARLERLSVTGLRCLHGLELTFEPLTALIGPNGAGKSSTVRAIEFLFGVADVDEGDCSEGLAGEEVCVTGVFSGIPAIWARRLAPWLGTDGTLTISRTVAHIGAGGRAVAQWTTWRSQVDGFGEIRRHIAAGEPVASVIKPAYQTLRMRYDGLPAWQSKPQVLAALDEYEEANPDIPRMSEADHTLRFTGRDDFDLTGMIELLVLPALRDAADDATESRGSNLARLVELTVRSQMDLSNELDDLAARTQEAYRQIIADHAEGPLDKLSLSITAQLERFAPGASVHLSWDHRLPSLETPAVRARLRESGHEADIGRQGHGVQRAYVFSLLRALLDARHTAHASNRPAVLLVIEEPEVYQHPVRARYVAGVLARLARDAGQATQVAYTTHSPYFVSVDNVPAVRLLRLRQHPTVPKLRVTRAAHAALTEVASQLEQARDGRGRRPWTAQKVAASLPGLLGSDVSEGLFADTVVLVEGEEDTGMIDGAAAATGADLSAEGIALIAVRGKDRLRLATAIFTAFEVPAFVVFDTDVPTNAVPSVDARWHNTALTSLAGGPRELDPGTCVTKRWASAQPTLRATIDAEIGAATVSAAFHTAAREMSLPECTEKNGHLVRTAITALYQDGHRSSTLDRIVEAARALRAHG